MKSPSVVVFHPDFNFGDFRYAVARYVKLLIRARWKTEPGFFFRKDLMAWGMQDIERDPWPACKLIDQAAIALGLLNTHFLPRCGSGGVRETDESTPTGRLIYAIVSLVPTEGGGPSHNGPLLRAAQMLRDGNDADWSSMVEWASLEAIRTDLDLLPHPRGEISPTDPYLGLVDTLGRLADALGKGGMPLANQTLPPEALSKEDAAKYLGVTSATIEHLIRTRKIKYVQFGSQRGRVIPVEALRQLLHDNLQLTAEEELRRRRRR